MIDIQALKELAEAACARDRCGKITKHYFTFRDEITPEMILELIALLPEEYNF